MRRLHRSSVSDRCLLRRIVCRHGTKKNWFQRSLNSDVTKGSGTLVSVPLQTGPTRLQFYQEAVNTQLTATDSSMIGCSPGYGDQSGGTFKLT